MRSALLGSIEPRRELIMLESAETVFSAWQLVDSTPRKSRPSSGRRGNDGSASSVEAHVVEWRSPSPASTL